MLSAHSLRLRIGGLGLGALAVMDFWRLWLLGRVWWPRLLLGHDLHSRIRERRAPDWIGLQLLTVETNDTPRWCSSGRPLDADEEWALRSAPSWIKANGARAGYTGDTPPKLHELLLLDAKLLPAEKSQSYQPVARVILGRVANNTSILGLMPVLVSKRRTNAPLSVPDQLSHVYLRRFGLALLLFSPYLYQYCRYLRVSLYKEDFARIIQKLCSRWKQESEFSATNLGVALHRSDSCFYRELCTLSPFKRLSSYA